MMRWWHILLLSEFYRFQARSIIEESCIATSPAITPEHCIRKCVQLLYDNRLCAICDKDKDSSANFRKTEETLVHKRSMEWCTVCKNDQWEINSTQYEFYRHIADFFNDLEISWCIDALNLNEHNDIKKELHRSKRYNPGIGGAHSSPNSSIPSSEATMVMGMIIIGIFLLCAIGFLCKKLATNLNPQESYQINS